MVFTTFRDAQTHSQTHLQMETPENRMSPAPKIFGGRGITQWDVNRKTSQPIALRYQPVTSIPHDLRHPCFEPVLRFQKWCNVSYTC